MAHLTLQLGGPIVMPIGVRAGGRGGTDTPGWKLRSWREAYAVDAGLPVRRTWPRRHPALCGRRYPVAPERDAIEHDEA